MDRSKTSGSDIDDDAAGLKAAQLALLRMHVESEVPSHAAIMVTSARSGDGKSLTAHTLAESLARAGRSTMLVDARCDRAAAISASAKERPRVSYAQIACDPPDSSRETLIAFVRQLRSEHDVIVIDVPPLVTSDVAMALATIVDGILVTVRVGRAPSEEDGIMLEIVERAGGRIIGVVATEPHAIDRFEHRRQAIAGTAGTVGGDAVAPIVGVRSAALAALAK